MNIRSLVVRFPFFRSAATVAACACLLSASTGCSVNPATGKRQLTLISEAQEIQLGKESHEAIKKQMGVYPDEEVQKYVSDLGLKLAAASERPNLPWTFTVIDDPVVNAFALPGGFIYITRGIMGYMNSEAELISVMGHEIGHVTGRHGVEQMSKQQLAQVGFMVGMVASPQFRQFGQLAQQGLGLMFLKFSRDHEREADDLGLRYLARGGYDPMEMDNVFRTLGRVSAAQGAGRIPNWASTHPAPEDRVARIEEEVAAMAPEARHGKINREQFLEEVDHLTFGPDPRQGFFKDNVFYQPEMRFKLTFPAGWKTINQRQAVAAVSPEKDAIVVLQLADQDDPAAASSKFFSQQNIERGGQAGNNFFHFRTLTEANAQGQKPPGLRGIAGFFSYGGAVFQMLGYCKEDRWSNYDREINRAAGTFEVLNDPKFLNVRAARLETVKIPTSMTLGEFNRRWPSTIELEQLAIINGVTQEQRLDAGRLVKRVVGGELP